MTTTKGGIVTLLRLEAPPIASLFPSEYTDWGLCATCGVQTHEVFLRRDGEQASPAATTGTSPGTSSSDEEPPNDACTESQGEEGERVQLPLTIPGKIQLGRCLKCRPRRKKKSHTCNGDGGKKSSSQKGRRNRLQNQEEEPGSDDEVSDKSLFPDLLAETEEQANCKSSEKLCNGDISPTEKHEADDESTVVTLSSPSLLSTPHPLISTISHISHNSHGSEPSQGALSHKTESSEESAGTLWSVDSEETEDSLLRRVVSFAANANADSNADANANKEVVASGAPASPLNSPRYKRRTHDNESIGTSIATSLVSSHASFSSNSSSSSSSVDDDCYDSDEDTIISGNRSPGRNRNVSNKGGGGILKKKFNEIDSPPPMPLTSAHRTRSAPAPSTPPSSSGKLAREWSRIDSASMDADRLHGKRNISLPTNIDQLSGGGHAGRNRPKWTARSAILTHEEELQAMLQESCTISKSGNMVGASSDNHHGDDDETIDSTSGDIGCMAARLRKQYGIHNISFASGSSTASASSSSSKSYASVSGSNCSGHSGKASSLLSGGTASTTTDSSSSGHSTSSSGWVTQSQVGEKKSWNKKVLGFFAADKILGRHNNHRGNVKM